MNHSQIARELGLSRTTVAKYANKDDYSPRSGGSGTGRSLVDQGWADIVDGWLTADLRLPMKQRHTAVRVHERLVAECGFPGEYPSVQRWVHRWRVAHADESEGFAELEWAPGSAQADFGQARAVVKGVEVVVHFLAVSFPYSNMRYVVALPAETAECLCHGLAVVFAYIGMVPRVLAVDNAAGAGHRNPDGTVTQTRLFSLLCAHYGFEARFCNPYSGHEKGSVENAVGFVRRNLMVPVPSAESMEALSAAWLAECDRIAGRDHYRKDEPVRDLFETELDHMIPLPGARFDACDWRMVKADKTGTVTVDGNRYLAGPKWRSARLKAGVRAFEIELRDPDGGRIITLERAWGHETRTRLNPSALLAIIARKPRVWGESPIRGDFPQPVRDLLDRMDGRARRDLIDDIRAVSASCGFAATVKAAAMVIDAGRSLDRAAIETTARRILQGGSGDSSADLKRYDKYMEARDER